MQSGLKFASNLLQLTFAPAAGHGRVCAPACRPGLCFESVELGNTGLSSRGCKLRGQGRCAGSLGLSLQ